MLLVLQQRFVSLIAHIGSCGTVPVVPLLPSLHGAETEMSLRKAV